MSKRGLDRRRLLGAGLAAAAGPALAKSRSPAVQINLSDQLPPPPPPGEPPEIISAGADASRRMTAPVLLNGHGPFTFVVDTGANSSVVASEAALSLKLPGGDPTPVHGIAGMETAQTVQVGSLSVGDVRTSDLLLPILASDRLGAQGLLGVDVMKNRHVVLNFLDSVLEIGPSRHEVGVMSTFEPLAHDLGAHKSLVIVPARYRFGQLTIVDADVGGQAVTAFLDSGSQNTVANLALRNALLGRQPTLRSSFRSVELLSATGQTASGDLCPLPPLRLGGLRIDGLNAVFADLHTFAIWRLLDRPAILIGVDVLRHFAAVELDFGRRRVVFRATKASTVVYG